MLRIRKKDWIEIVLHIAFWVGVFYTLLSFTQPHIKMRINQNGNILEEDIRYTLSPHLFLALGFMILLFYSNILWLFKKALRFRNILIKVVLPVAWFGVIFLADTYVDTLLPAQRLDDAMIMPPPRKGQDSIGAPLPVPSSNKIQIAIKDTNLDRVRKMGFAVPDVNVRREISRQQSKAYIFQADGFSNTLLFIFIIIFGLSAAYFFLMEWARVEKIRSQLQAVQLDTEVKFLKSQVNPHFLFNTLNNLFSMAQKEENDELADGISKLSGMMRYMIYESNADLVPLKKEIDYLEDCIALNKLRYADNEVDVSFKHPRNSGGITVAPMLFIPFVENAFKHGVAIGHHSQIVISISVQDKKLIFTCENPNFSAIKKMEEEKGGIGLENVRRRLELVYPGKHRLRIEESDGKYLVNLEIDLA